MTAQVIDLRARLDARREDAPSPWMCGFERRGPQSYMWCRLMDGHDGGCVLRSPRSATTGEDAS